MQPVAVQSPASSLTQRIGTIKIPKLGTRIQVRTTKTGSESCSLTVSLMQQQNKINMDSSAMRDHSLAHFHALLGYLLFKKKTVVKGIYQTCVYGTSSLPGSLTQVYTGERTTTHNTKVIVTSQSPTESTEKGWYGCTLQRYSVITKNTMTSLDIARQGVRLEIIILCEITRHRKTKVAFSSQL